MDIIMSGGAFIVLWLVCRNMIQEHDDQHTKSDECANKPLPMTKPKTKKRLNDTCD